MRRAAVSLVVALLFSLAGASPAGAEVLPVKRAKRVILRASRIECRNLVRPSACRMYIVRCGRPGLNRVRCGYAARIDVGETLLLLRCSAEAIQWAHQIQTRQLGCPGSKEIHQ